MFWGCSRYPKCDFTTSHEPLGATHDADAGPVARKGEDGAMCLQCGSTIDLPAASIVPGTAVSGGPPDPAALARPSRGGRGAPRGGGRSSGRGGGRTRSTKAASGRSTAGRSRGTERAPGA